MSESGTGTQQPLLWTETREIPLTQGKFAIVDDADYEYLMQWKWCANFQHGIWYAVRTVRPTLIRMHRIILDAPSGIVVDHRDGNGLNNSRSNIRLCTTSQNLHNISRIKGSSSTYKGVSWCKSRQVWEAQIKCNGISKYLGRFADELEAAKAYDEAARILHGKFARLNFPIGDER